ncbi:hypothetical protein Hanom_Chr09g00840541 [Helianthus anomalus]
MNPLNLRYLSMSLKIIRIIFKNYVAKILVLHVILLTVLFYLYSAGFKFTYFLTGFKVHFFVCRFELVLKTF